MANFLRTKKGKDFLNVVFSIGAAIVIFGALAKIEHWGGAWGNALVIGMITETFTFLLMAFQPPEKEYHWEKLFPNLTVSPEDEMKSGGYKQKDLTQGMGGSNTGSPLSGMDNMLEEADITPANLKKLSDNFQKFNQTVVDMGTLSNTVAVTNEFSKQTEAAAHSMGAVSEAYKEAAESMSSFNGASEKSKEFHAQMDKMANNLSSLNAIYELEIENADEHQKKMKQFHGSLNEISEAMSEGVADAHKTKEQIALMAKNMENLNNVYGNMLSAMNNH